ncbi:MAG: PEP-CTERM sorting domain-containing protein [Burkholderiaceae bacterium]|nr:PEP-CTERM sorting domain-containing protein [Burkholderiaceae bacterium]
MQETIRSIVLWGSLAPMAAMGASFTSEVSVTTTGNAINVGGVIVTPTCQLVQASSANCSTELNNANARVGPGYMQLSAFSTVSAGANQYSGGTARAQATFSDGLTFSSLALAGKTVTVSGSVIVEGVLSAGVGASFGGARASWTGYGGALGVGLTNQGIKEAYAGGAVPAPDQNVNGYLFPIVASLQFDAFGHAVSSIALTMIVDAQGSVSSQGSATAGAAFGNTVYWSGIESLKVDGATFSGDYTVTSASGANYRFSTSPVPESSTLGMMLAGLALLAAFKLRKG